MHSDWLFQVTWLVLTNRIAIFQYDIDSIDCEHTSLSKPCCITIILAYELLRHEVKSVALESWLTSSAFSIHFRGKNAWSKKWKWPSIKKIKTVYCHIAKFITCVGRIFQFGMNKKQSLVSFKFATLTIFNLLSKDYETKVLQKVKKK